MHPTFPQWAAFSLLVAGLGLLGAGYLIRRRESHLATLSGWILVGIYWPLQAPHFLAIDDVVNAAFTVLALPFFLYLAYHESLSYVRDEDPRGLRWMTGTVFAASTIYFVFHQWEPMARFMITLVAEQTTWMLNLSHPGYVMGAFTPVPGSGTASGAGQAIGSLTGASTTELAPGYVPIHMTNDVFGRPKIISIVLACTAMQAISIFAGAIAVAPSAGKRKLKAFALTVPTIYVLNLFRNWGIIFGVDRLGYRFDVLHNWIGKGGSLLALIGLAVLLFELLPEVHEAILEVLELPKRDGPIEDGMRRVLGITEKG